MGSPLDDTDAPPGGVDLAAAEVYIEAGDRPIGGGGRWYIVSPDKVPADRPDLAVVFQRPNRKFAYRSMLTASMLRTDPRYQQTELAQGEPETTS